METQLFVPVASTNAITSHRSSRYSKPTDVPIWWLLPIAPLMGFCVLAFGWVGIFVVPAYFLLIEYIRRSKPDKITLFADRLEVEGMFPVMIELSSIDRITGGKAGFGVYLKNDPFFVDTYSFRLLGGEASNFFPYLYATAGKSNDQGSSNIKFELSSPFEIKFI